MSNRDKKKLHTDDQDQFCTEIFFWWIKFAQRVWSVCGKDGRRVPKVCRNMECGV